MHSPDAVFHTWASHLNPATVLPAAYDTAVSLTCRHRAPAILGLAERNMSELDQERLHARANAVAVLLLQVSGTPGLTLAAYVVVRIERDAQGLRYSPNAKATRHAESMLDAMHGYGQPLLWTAPQVHRFAQEFVRRSVADYGKVAAAQAADVAKATPGIAFWAAMLTGDPETAIARM